MKLLARLALLAVLPLPLGLAPASAQQDYDRPPAGYGDDAAGSYGRDPDYPGARAPVDAPDPASLAVRVSKLESRIREMTGQIEELQNNNRKLVEQLQKFQADVDSRLTSSGGGRQKRSEAETPRLTPDESGAAMDAEPAAASKLRKSRRDDAFDPDAAPTGAPGQPKPLGTVASAQSDTGAGTPMALSGGKLSRETTDDTLAPTLRLPSATPKQTGGTVTPGGTVIASTGNAAANSPRAEFDVAIGYYRDKQYEDAEKGFTAFIQKNPKSKLAADATYYLGESYAQRGRSREAAEQYLKISTDYATSSRAPDAMLHLGISLKALGAKEQACATFSEVSRKYPNAPAYVRSGAEREAKRAQC